MNISPDAASKTTRILLVDDDPGLIRRMAALLRDHGQIYFTTQGSEAVEMALKLLPDIILLDVLMPDMDGLEVCQQIKAIPELSDIPLLFVTAHNDPELEAQALESGALDFISKPPHPAILKARVGNYLALKQKNDTLRNLSLLDGLTGVANRRAFEQALKNEWRRAQRNQSSLALLMVDIDHFKQFNDQYGHQSGDECLQHVAQALAKSCRRPGDLAARYGGEEFAVVLSECELQTAVQIANDLREEIADLSETTSFTSTPLEAPISISIGVSTSLCLQPAKDSFEAANDDTITPTKLVHEADLALYRAKQNGRNRVESCVEYSAGMETNSLSVI